MVESDARRAVAVVEAVVAWAKRRAEIRGVALVGSRATGKARPDADIDLILLTAEPDKFRVDWSWVGDIVWAGCAVSTPSWSDENYGVVWSRRISLGSGLEAEMSFASLSCASTAPLDPGTRRVISDGCQIFYDPDDLLELLRKATKKIKKLAAGRNRLGCC